MRWTALLIMLCSSLPAMAVSKHAPLPDAVYAAKTVYISNQTGDQAALDMTYSELVKWKRYDVVGNKAKADLIIVLSAVSDPHQGGSVRGVQLEVMLPASEDAAYQTTEWYIFFHQAPKLCIEDFRKRVEEKH
jgi:hypothetical protein